MCRLYGFRSNEPTRVECTLVHSQNALIVQSQTDFVGKSHAHGWGIATYEEEFPLVERQAWAAYRDEQFREAAARIYSGTVLAHVRRATVGEPTIENTHPFTEGCWTFIHNGTIPFIDVVGDQMRAAMSERHREHIRGQTDSEHFFRLLMSMLDADGHRLEHVVAEAARLVIGWCRDIDPDVPIGLNVLITDGDQLVGLRWGRGLYFVERAGVRDCEVCRYPHVRSEDEPHRYRAVVVASEPLTHGEEWIEVPDGSLISVTDRFGLSIESLGLEPPLEPAGPTRRAAASRVRTTLIDEFMADHLGLGEGFDELLQALRDRDGAAVFAAAEKIDETSGGHIAFEEVDLYPALGAGPEMYEDHRVGLDTIRRVLALEGAEPSEVERAELMAQAGEMVDHMDHCGTLLSEVRRLAPAVQSDLELRLLEWRGRRPQWTKESWAVASVGRT